VESIYAGVPTTFVIPVLGGSDLSYDWTIHGASHTVVETDGNAIVIVFDRNESYVVSVVVWNNVSGAEVHVELVSRAVRCSPPSFQLIGSARRSQLRSRKILIETVVSSDCLDYRLRHEWSVWIGNCVDVDANSSVSLPKLIRTDTPTLFMPARTLVYGVYCIIFESCFYEAPGCTNVSVDVEVKESSLRAIISGGDERSVVVSENIIFDGSVSYDPDIDKEASSFLSYNWTCQVVFYQFSILCMFAIEWL